MIPITLIKLPILLVKTTYFFVANFVKGTIDLAHLFNVIGIIPITLNSLSILLVKTALFLVINFVKGTTIKKLTSFG